MESIAAQIDENQYLYERHLAQNSFTEFFESNGIAWMESEIELAAFNGVIQSSVSVDNAVETIEKMVGYLKERQIPFSWKIWEASLPSHLPELLERSGLKKILAGTRMSLELRHLHLDERLDENLEVKKVEDEQDRNEWMELVFENFGFSCETRRVYSSLFKERGFSYPAVHLLGLYKGKPVATAAVFYGGGTAGLYWVSTAEEYRGKKFGSEITRHALKMIKEEGLEQVILQSSKLGYPVYKKIGFEEFKQNIKFTWEPSI